MTPRSDIAPGSLLHVAHGVELAACAAEDDYAPQGFAAEGFIHCCRPEQLDGVLERHFDDRSGLVLLELEPSALPVPPVEEDTSGRGERFPHLYARIPWSAMLRRRPLEDEASRAESGSRQRIADGRSEHQDEHQDTHRRDDS